MQIRQISESELPALMALYRHLHEADDPIPDEAHVAAVWRELLGNPRCRYFGGYVGDQLVCSCTASLLTSRVRMMLPSGVICGVTSSFSTALRNEMEVAPLDVACW